MRIFQKDIVFVISTEAEVNNNGSFNLVKKLILTAVEAKVD
jgi:sialic acid synthase SpsE